MDPIYCISSPGYANRAMLKYTKAEIKLITDVNIYLIIEKGVRGGRCEPIFIRAKANNKYINPNFNKNKDIESHIVSLDVNSLYPTAMSYKLQYGKFKYDENTSIYIDEHIMNIDTTCNYFYVFVVDIDYPKELHDEHEELPLLVDQKTPPNHKVKKLISDLSDKKNYTISIHMLQFVLKKGLKLRKTHAVVYAKQKTFMKPFIELNNKKRTEASINNDQIGVQYYKSNSNATFGKQMENIKKYKSFHIVNNPKKVRNSLQNVFLKMAYII